jgi:hypothetical protein
VASWAVGILGCWALGRILSAAHVLLGFFRHFSAFGLLGILAVGHLGCWPLMHLGRGRQDHLFFDLKSNQSLDLFLLILDLRSIFKKN